MTSFNHRTVLIVALFLAFVVPALNGCERFRNFTDMEHVQRAKDFQAKGKLKEAVIELKNAVSKNGNNTEARWLLGEAYVTAEQGEAAEKELKRARELGVAPDAVSLSIGRAYLLQGKYQNVLDEIQTGGQMSARRQAEVLRLRGDALLGSRRGKEACDVYTQSNRVDAAYVDVYHGLALCAVGIDKDAQRARALLDKALKLEPGNAATWNFIGEWERSNGSVENAEKAFSESIRLDPHGRAARYNRAVINLDRGRLGDAEKDHAVLRERFSQAPQTLIVDAMIQFMKRNHDKARDALGRLEKLAPNYPPAWLLQAMVANATHSYGVADQQVSRYLAVRPRDAIALRLKAKLMIRSGRPALALEFLTPLLGSPNPDQELLVLAGRAHMDLKNYAKATQLLEQAVQLDPRNVPTQSNLALGYLAAGQDDRGVEVLQTAARLSEQSSEADLMLAAYYQSKGELAKALSALDALDKKKLANAEAHNMRGNILARQGDRQGARKSYEKAMAADAAFLPAAQNLAILDLKEKRPDAARKHFQKVLAKDKASAGAMLALADIAWQEKKEAEYVNWVEKAGQAAPNALEPKTRLVAYALSKREPQKALALAREAVAVNENSAQAWELLGQAQLAVGEKQNAVASFTRVVQLAPDSPRGHFYLGAALAEIERFDEARKSLGQALKLSPAYVEPRRALIAIEIKQKRLAEAQALAEDLTRREPMLAAGPTLEGDVLIARKQFAQAASAYERASALAGSGLLAIRIHQSRMLAGDTRHADEGIEAWLRLHPEDVSARLYWADSLALRKDFRRAAAQYENVMAKSPENATALNNLAATYGELGDARAVTMAERAYRLQPKDPAIQDTLGWLLLARGEAVRARELLESAARAAPKASNIRFHYANALFKEGRRNDAKAELGALLNENKDFPERDAAIELRRQLQ